MAQLGPVPRRLGFTRMYRTTEMHFPLLKHLFGHSQSYQTLPRVSVAQLGPIPRRLGFTRIYRTTEMHCPLLQQQYRTTEMHFLLLQHLFGHSQS